MLRFAENRDAHERVCDNGFPSRLVRLQFMFQPNEKLAGSRREAFRLRLFDALLFLLTVLFDIAAEDPTRQSISICPSILDLTQKTILGKYLHGWATGSFFASNRKYSIGANAECQRCFTADVASSGRCGPLPASWITPGLTEHRSG